MKLLYLTSVLIVPSAEGEVKIKKALKRTKNGRELKDEHGRTREQYEDLGIPTPNFFTENEDTPEISEDGTILLREEEMEFNFVDAIIKLKDFSSCIDNQQIGSVIYTRQGDEIHVEESVEDIFSYINYLTRPWHERITDSIKSKWWRIKYFWRKKQSKKDIIINFETQEITKE